MEGLQFSTKANNLRQIKPYLKQARILQQECITLKEWNADAKQVTTRLQRRNWLNIPLIVRSSAYNEDTKLESMAGKYTSVLNVCGKYEVANAIERVIESYHDSSPDEQILIQPMLDDVVISGVAFSMDPNNGGNYIVIEYDDQTGRTDTITSGKEKERKTFYYFKGSPLPVEGPMKKVVELVKELEDLYETDKIDVEFAIDGKNILYLLQVRPLISKIPSPPADEQYGILSRISDKVKDSRGHKPFLYGNKTVYGVMPDWNPAEIIGIRPRPLALSLYKELVTDYVWAYQREHYGYKDLKSFPLMVDFGGIPYIDVRVSFNSFLTRDLDPELSEKLVNYYLDQLIQNKSNHDKVEFEIIYSCFTFDLDDRLEKLLAYGFSQEEVKKISDSLKKLTRHIVEDEDGYLHEDLEAIKRLESRREEIMNSSLDTLSKIYWLLEDCKRYGTLPFAGLARGGFIAVQMLQSLKTQGILSEQNYQDFMGELNTISSQMATDFYNLDKREFLKKYGHLRPGTYDIRSKRYDEDDGKYFDFDNKEKPVKQNKFSLSLFQMNRIQVLLDKYGMNQNVLKLFNFLKFAIEGREYSKFIFTKNLSDAISLLEKLGGECGFTKEEMSFITIDLIYKAYSSERDLRQLLADGIAEGKERYKNTLQINLPAVIVDETEVWAFSQEHLEPNYITLKKGVGEVAFVDEECDLEHKIVFIENADPGYDWIFSKRIAGFVTMYGGVNSHMAIRAGELSIPAVIGVGEANYRYYSKAKFMEIDCESKSMRILQ